MHLVLNVRREGAGRREALQRVGVGREKAFRGVMAHFKKIPLRFLSPIPIRRRVFLSHLQRRGGK